MEYIVQRDMYPQYRTPSIGGTFMKYSLGIKTFFLCQRASCIKYCIANLLPVRHCVHNHKQTNGGWFIDNGYPGTIPFLPQGFERRQSGDLPRDFEHGFILPGGAVGSVTLAQEVAGVVSLLVGGVDFGCRERGD